MLARRQKAGAEKVIVRMAWQVAGVCLDVLNKIVGTQGRVVSGATTVAVR